MDADGSNPRNLSQNPLNDGGDGGFALSPDGRKIAFGTNRDKNGEIYVMNADGSGQRRLTRTSEFESVIGWSPDGRKIAFKREPVKPRGAFFVVNADGSGERKVTWSLAAGKS